mmetsp:Transcript_20399/g.18537  ORF Transcript_20399/g.18537 Transcript_20399/m.18537 type:complete len:203 (+) Transcript_20399:56-664(+)
MTSTIKYAVILTGTIHSGKTNFFNALTGDIIELDQPNKIFRVKCDDRDYNEKNAKTIILSNGKEITLVDTPGLSQNLGVDKDYLSTLKTALEKEGYRIICLIICMNFTPFKSKDTVMCNAIMNVFPESTITRYIHFSHRVSRPKNEAISEVMTLLKPKDFFFTFGDLRRIDSESENDQTVYIESRGLPSIRNVYLSNFLKIT